MGRLGFLYFLIMIFTLGCESKKEDHFANEIRQNALDVTVGKVGVVITIDSLTCFNHEMDSNLVALNNIDTIIYDLQTSLPIQEIVKDKTIKILNDNKYNYHLVNNYNAEDFPKEQLSKDNKNLIDYNKLKKNYNFDDLFLINVKVGLDQDSLETSDITAKTYITLNILDLNNKIVKYSESIGGSKYLTMKNKGILLTDAKALINESLNETFNLIDNK